MKPTHIRSPSISKCNVPMRTGIPSLDLLLKGGIPIGTLVLIEESADNDISSILSKAFLGEGAASSDYLFYYSETPENAVPDIRRIGNSSLRGDFSVRYETFSANSLVTEPYAIDLSSIKTDYPNLFQRTVDCSEENFYHNLWKTITNDTQASYSNSSDITLRRICIKSIFSMNWPQMSYSEIFEFLRSIKTLLRSRNAVCILTAPFEKIDEKLKPVIIKNSDLVILTEPHKLIILKSPKTMQVEKNSVYSLSQSQGTTLVEESRVT